jgi:hypothetical protein
MKINNTISPYLEKNSRVWNNERGTLVFARYGKPYLLLQERVVLLEKPRLSKGHTN